MRALTGSDGRSRLARTLIQLRAAARPRPMEGIAALFATTERSRRLRTWMSSLLSRRIHRSRLLSVGDGSRNLSNYSLRDPRRDQNSATDTNGSRSGIADFSPIGIGALAGRLAVLTGQMNRVTPRVRYARLSLDDGGTGNASGMERHPSTPESARPHGPMRASNASGLIRSTRQITRPVGSPDAAEAMTLGRRSLAARTPAIEFEMRLTALFNRTGSRSPRPTSDQSVADGRLAITATGSPDGLSRRRIRANPSGPQSYLPAGRARAERGNPQTDRDAIGHTVQRLYTRAVQLSSLRFGSEQISASAITASNQGRAYRGHLEQSGTPIDNVSGNKHGRANAAEAPAPFVVNFSPNVVINDNRPSIDFEHQVVQTIARHSHELVSIVMREIQSRRRAAFQER